MTPNFHRGTGSDARARGHISSPQELLTDCWREAEDGHKSWYQMAFMLQGYARAFEWFEMAHSAQQFFFASELAMNRYELMRAAELEQRVSGIEDERLYAEAEHY